MPYCAIVDCKNTHYAKEWTFPAIAKAIRTCEAVTSADHSTSNGSKARGEALGSIVWASDMVAPTLPLMFRISAGVRVAC